MKLRLRREIRLTIDQAKKLDRILPLFGNSFTKFVKFHLSNKDEKDYKALLDCTKNNKILIQQIQKIGVNVNQMSRVLNSNKSNITKVNFDKMHADIQAFSKEIHEIKLKIMSDDH
jgi:hypothetical protein